MKILQKTATTADRLACMLRFVEEREQVRIRKEKGEPRPWTKDEILGTYHFCNVRRADDRVTKWIGEWARHWARRDRWFAYAVARWFNEPDTLAELPGYFDATTYKSILRKMINNRQHVFRGSYIINGFPGIPKYVSVVDRVLTTLWQADRETTPVIAPRSLEKTHENLMRFPGMGSFMAGQIVADWQTFGEMHGKDIYTWAPLGPGSARGIQWVFGLEKKLNQTSAIGFMQETREYMLVRNQNLISTLTLHDIQNCFCEFSKYVRGYSKTKYRPFEESFL